MQISTLRTFGGLSLILGSVLFLVYSILLPLLLPMNEIFIDFTRLVLQPSWIWLGVVAFFGILFMLFGFIAVYSKLFSESGWIGLVGFIFLEIAYLFQACKVSWEIFLWPGIAANPGSIFLLRDKVLFTSSLVGMFELISGISILIGIIFFCIALVRSRNFPKIGGVLIFAGAIIYGIGPFLPILISLLGIFILSVGCTIIGLTLIKPQSN